MRVAGDGLGVHVLVELHVARVDAEDFQPPVLVGHADVDLAVEAWFVSDVYGVVRFRCLMSGFNRHIGWVGLWVGGWGGSGNADGDRAVEAWWRGDAWGGLCVLGFNMHILVGLVCGGVVPGVVCSSDCLVGGCRPLFGWWVSPPAVT